MPKICQNDSGSVVKVVHKILQNNTYIVNDTNGDTKEIYKTEAVTVVSSILSVALFGLVIFGLVFKYRKFLKIWCFIKFGWKFNLKPKKPLTDSCLWSDLLGVIGFWKLLILTCSYSNKGPLTTQIIFNLESITFRVKQWENAFADL